MKSPLFLPWLMTYTVIILLCIGVAFAHTYHWQNPLTEDERIFWRTISYVLTILTLPITNLLRHIFLRLNQTMPLLASINSERVVKTRYTLTISISMLLMVFVGGLGSVLFYLGEDFNTLHILTGVAVLGVFLYRPKLHEYQQIFDALATLTSNENEQI